MNDTLFWTILILVFIVFIIFGILSERKKNNILNSIIEKYDFENNGFITKKIKKDYERKSENGIEFIWLNKNQSHFTLTVGINFVPTNEYKNRKFFEETKFIIAFHKRNKEVQLFGQTNPILISKIEIKKEDDIPDFKEICRIYNNLTIILKKERLIKTTHNIGYN